MKRKELTPEQKDLQFLEHVLLDMHGDKIRNEFEAALILADYRRTHGNQGLKDMIGFLNFAKSRKLDSHTVKATITHDLNGRTDKHMQPRTQPYSKFYQTPNQ